MHVRVCNALCSLDLVVHLDGAQSPVQQVFELVPAVRRAWNREIELCRPWLMPKLKICLRLSLWDWPCPKDLGIRKSGHSA